MLAPPDDATLTVNLAPPDDAKLKVSEIESRQPLSERCCNVIGNHLHCKRNYVVKVSGWFKPLERNHPKYTSDCGFQVKPFNCEVTKIRQKEEYTHFEFKCTVAHRSSGIVVYDRHGALIAERCMPTTPKINVQKNTSSGVPQLPRLVMAPSEALMPPTTETLPAFLPWFSPYIQPWHGVRAPMDGMKRIRITTQYPDINGLYPCDHVIEF